MTIDYLLNEIGRTDEKQSINWKRILSIVEICLNYIGLVIMLFDAITLWGKNFCYTCGMGVLKVIRIVFMELGTTVFCLSLDNRSGYERIRKFLRINIFLYSMIVSMVVYLLEVPYLREIIIYVIVVIVTKIILMKKKNNNLFTSHLSFHNEYIHRYYIFRQSPSSRNKPGYANPPWRLCG